MNYLLCFSAMLAVTAVSAATDYYYPVVPIQVSPLRSSSSNYIATSSSAVQQQYHTQDSYGQYSYGYSEPLSSKQESRSLDGVTRGSYSYLDATGKIQTVEYKADAAGFRIISASDLPKDTADVVAARTQHLVRKEKVQQEEQEEAEEVEAAAKVRVGIKTDDAAVVRTVALPKPVEDTPEVAAAKSEFFQRYAEEVRRHKLLRNREGAGAIVLKTSQSTQPITLITLPTYQQELLPHKGFTYKYDVVLPAAHQRTYLPVI